MSENHQDKGENKMKTRIALWFYCIAIALLAVSAAVIVLKLIFWPPCTQSGNTCVIDPWPVAGLAGTILGVAATLLAILGAVAVAGWWLGLNKRVSDQVKGEVDAANKRVTEQINKVYSDQVASLNDRMTDQVNRLYSEQAEEIEKKMHIEILKNIVTKFELEHLGYFNSPEPFIAVNNENFIPELRHLQLLGFIRRQHYHGINTLEEGFRKYGQVNVKDHFYITEAGRDYWEQVK